MAPTSGKVGLGQANSYAYEEAEGGDGADREHRECASNNRNVGMRKAQSVQDIIAVQTQLGQITEQIEQLKGQIAYLDHNTTYSSISVSIAEVGAPAQTKAVDQWGFATALSDSAHNFVTTINYILTGLGAIGPILILLGLGYLLWRRSGSPGLKHA